MSTGLDAQQQIFARDPDDRRAFEALEEHFFLEGDWPSLARLYSARIDAPSIAASPDQQAALLFRLGQILEERVLDASAASEVYWRLARLDPGNRPALRQLRGIHERREQWDMVLQIAELESQTDMPPYERAAFESAMGRYWQQGLGDPDEALAAYERALAADPEFPEALAGLAELHEAAGRLDAAAEHLERLAERLRGPERAPVWISLGQLYAGPLGEPVRAGSCFARALEDDPYQMPAVEWALLLETANENWHAVSELLERRFDLAAGARHRAAIAVEASQIQLNHLGSVPAARAWIDRATELAQDEASVLLAVAEVERAEGDPDALLLTLDRLIEISGPATPRGVLIEAARLHARFGQLDAALAAIGRAVEKPGDDDRAVLEVQADLLRQSGAKNELVEVLETLTALDGHADSDAHTDLLRELARLHEEDLGDEAAARGAWQRAFDRDPADVESCDALERIHRKTNDWSALRVTLEAALAARPEADHDALLGRLGELLLDAFEDDAGARERFETALRLNPHCRPALAGLRRIAERSGDPDLLLTVCEQQAADCRDGDELGELARLCVPLLVERRQYEAALDWACRWQDRSPEARQALEWRAEFESRLDRPEAEVRSRRALARLQQGAEQLRTLRRQAELHRRLGELPEAAAALEQALEGEPGDAATWASLATAYRELERTDALARTLRQWADVLPEPEQPPVLEELADLLHDPLGDLEAAIVVRWRLWEHPHSSEETQPKLEALLELAGRYSELAHLLGLRRERLGDNSPEAFDLDRRRGRLLLDALGQCDEAAEIFERLLERHPDDESLVEDLERALRAGDDAAGLCALLERRAGWETDESRRVEMLFERASLLEEALAEPLQACDLYERIHEECPTSPHGERARERLERLLESQGQWTRLRDLLSARIDTTPDPERPALRERIAQICRERIGDVAGCAEQLEAIAESAPERLHVWQQLEEIYRYELDRPSDWLRVVETELAAEPDLEREFSLRVGAARLLLDDARRPADRSDEEAIAHFERVLQLDAGHPEAAEFLARHYSANHRPEDTLRVLETRLAHLADSEADEKCELRMRLAGILRDELDRPPEAIRQLEAIREVEGAASRVAEPLAELFEEASDHDGLAELAAEVLEGEVDASRLPCWRLRLARSEWARGDLEAAAAAYRAVLTASPGDRESEDALIAIYEQLDEFEPLAALIEKRLPYAGVEEAIALRLRLARLCAEQRQDPSRALDELEQLLAQQPQHRDAFAMALELAGRIGDDRRLLALLDGALETSLTAAERAALLERRGRLFAERLDDPEQALPSLREAIALEPHREGTRTLLRSQLERLERWPAVLDCLFVEASQAEGEARTELYEEAAEIAWRHVGPDASLPWLARLREERPEDPGLCARLAEVHQRAGRFEAALRALDEELRLRSGSDERARLHTARARMLERDLHAPGRAILAYREALEIVAIDEERSEILSELDRLYTEAERPLERAEILEQRLSHAAADQHVEMRRTLAALYCVDLAKPERAIGPLLHNVAATRAEPAEQIGHLGALGAALRAGARHDAWARVAEQELALIETHRSIRESTPADYRRFLREELARVYDEELGNPDRALDHLRALEREEGGTPRSAARLRELLRRTGRVSELADALARHLETAPDESRDWLELGLLREERLHDLQAAVEAFREAARDEALASQALCGQRRVCERLQDWTGVAEALEAELERDSEASPRERAACARRLGAVVWERLGDDARAGSAYEQALELDAADVEALRALAEIRESTGDRAATHALFRRELELLGESEADRGRARDIWLRLARELRPETERATEALEAYRAADRIDPLAPDDQRSMAELHDALGEHEAYCEVFARWCDRPDSSAQVSDHLALARRLADAGEAVAARLRADRATQIDASRPDAWSYLAELERESGRLEAAAGAFSRAAQVSSASDAATCCVEAARCLEDTDAARARELLAEAIRHDPACVPGHVALARLADRLDQPAEALEEVETALELSAATPLEASERLELARLGARAAEALGDEAAARRLHAEVLEIDADDVEALEGVARSDFEAGDYRAARLALEHRIEQPGENPRLGAQLAMIARGLEAEDLLDAAWPRYEEALELDPERIEAHEGLVRVHERAARPEEALRCLEEWSRRGEDRELRAQAALRASEHALALDDTARARRNLEEATRLDPGLTSAWHLLCELLGQNGSPEQARRACESALAEVEPGPLSARIALRAARLAELAGETERARERYAEAWRWEPRCVDAALNESRLARSVGDWVEADAVLARFLEAHPDLESPTLAHVHLERGRLLSGPLEGFEEAISAYRRALDLQPGLQVARTALAGLLVHAPGRWREALDLHREILTGAPATGPSIRALMQIAEAQEASDLAGAARGLLRALGQASPTEAANASRGLPFALHPGPPMADPAGERLRRLVHLLRDELGGGLPATTTPRLDPAAEDLRETVDEIVAIESELAAPGIGLIDADERRRLFTSLGALFLDPGGNGGDPETREGLDRSIGRWTRRKARRIAEETSVEEIAALDHEAWGFELRAIAGAQLIDRRGGDVGPVLRALLVLESPDTAAAIADGAEIGALVAASDAPRRTLMRITQLLCEKLEQAG